MSQNWRPVYYAQGTKECYSGKAGMEGVSMGASRVQERRSHDADDSLMLSDGRARKGWVVGPSKRHTDVPSSVRLYVCCNVKCAR
jgi:hypothetical protein